MGYLDEYKKALQQEQKKQISTKSSSNSTSSYMNTYRQELAKLGGGGNAAPTTIVLPTTSSKKKNKKLDFFQKGAFEDGYQFGDISMTVGSSLGDLILNAGKGAAGMGEGLVDLGAYGVAAALEAEGRALGDKEKTKRADDIRKRYQKNAVDDFFAPMMETLDENSVFGRTSDSIAQAGGQIASIILTGGAAGAAGVSATAATTGMMGLSGMGSGMSQAYQEGATDGEALTYGAISGAADALSELMFGGLGKAVKGVGLSHGAFGLDDMLAKKVSGIFKNQIAKNIAEAGIKAGGEGFEEVVAGTAQAIGKKLTYADEKELSELIKDENLLEQFIVGAVASGISQAPSVHHANTSGTDFVTGFTQDEQAVIDKEIENRIAEQEVDGKKLTKREKNAIAEQVERDLDRGYISIDTIAEVLGGEDYTKHKELTKYESALRSEYAMLRSMRNGDKSTELEERQAELSKLIPTFNESKTNLHTKVFEGVRGSRLTASYGEELRKGQKFTADTSKYSEKQAAMVQRAIDSGVLNNTNRSHEFVDTLAKIEEGKGLTIHLTNNKQLKASGRLKSGATTNGWIDGDGNLVVNVDSAKALNSVVGHELTHTLEDSDSYKALRDTAFAHAEERGEYRSRLKSIKDLYSKHDANADPFKELTADLVGDYVFTDEKFVERLLNDDRSTFKKVMDEIKYLARVATAGSKEARELEKVKRAFEKAYKESGKAKVEGTKHSLSDSDGKQLTEAQQEYFKGSKMRDENGNLKVMYHGSQNAGFHTFDPSYSDDGISLFFVDRNDVATTYSSTSETYEAKTIRSAEDMNKFLAEIGQDEDYSVVEQDGKFTLLYDGDRVAQSDTAQGIYKEFCWYEGVGEGDANYKVYLNLKNPLEVDAQGKNWNNLTDWSKSAHIKAAEATVKRVGDEFKLYKGEQEIESASIEVNPYNENIDLEFLKSIMVDKANSSLSITTEHLTSTRDISKWAKANGYDGVIFKNIVDNGGYSNGSEGASTVAIAFDSNQIKSVANEAPTADKDIRYSLTEYTPEEKKAHNKAVLDHFGKTYKWAETGYVLLDGSKLDLSGKHEGAPGGYRTVDHRDIREAIGDDYGGDTYSGSLIQFMSEGNIRISPESNGINLSVKPNKAQEMALQDFISRARGEVLLDIDDFNGYTVASVEYPRGTHSNKVLKDIREWFDNGKHPEVSTTSQFRYSLSDAPINKVTENGLTMTFVRVPNQNTYNYGSTYGQNIEPAGEYMSMDTMQGKHKIDGYEYGTIQFKKPLVLEHINTSDTGWKKTVSDMYGGLTGKKLTKALIKDGYDAIVTYDDYGYNEIVNLNGKKLSLSEDGAQPTYGSYNIRGKDIALAPVDESVGNVETSEDSLPIADDSDFAPVTADGYALHDERELFPDDMSPMTDEYEADRTDSITDEDMPPEMEAPYYEDYYEGKPAEVKDPFKDRDFYEIGKQRNVKAYQYENPEVKPFFQSYAEAMLGDLRNSIKGEKIYNSQVAYEHGDEYAWSGQKRMTTEDIADLLDYGYTYAEIEKGLNDIIEDNGKENNAVAKRIEFMLNDRLMYGYTDINGYDVPANPDYIKLIEEKQISEYSTERAREAFATLDDADAPPEIAPIAAPMQQKQKSAAKAQQTIEAPIYDSKENGALKGQQTMFEPPKPNPKVATVLTEEQKKAKEKSGVGGKMVSALVDKGMVFENLSLETGNHELQAKYNTALPTYTDKKAQYFMENGAKAKGVKSLKDIRKKVEESGKTADFYDYLYHVHNADRMTLEDRFSDTPNKPVFGETVTADVSKRKAYLYEKANPEFKAMAEDIYKYNQHLRNLLVENGVISQETADLWQKMYPHYVPIRRVDTTGQNISVPLDTNKTGVNAPIKRATGGSSDIMPLFETMAMRTEQTYRAIARNAFGIELKNTLGTTIGTQKASVDDAIDMAETQDDLLKAGTMFSNPTFTVFENGERVEFEITEDMFEALKPANKILAHRSKTLTGISNFRRNLLTVWNPVFALYRNPIKDIQDVAINSQHAAKTYMNVPNAIYQMVTGGEYATEYHQNGGKSNTYFDSRTNQFKTEDNIFKKTIGLPIRAIETAGEFIEEIPRLAEYIASRQEGRSIDRSMLDAARVTTNFAAGGDFTKFLNSHGFTFLNASVQGASQHVRNFREAKQEGLKGYVKVLAKYTIAGLPTILLNGMLWDDDDEYEELSDYVKQNYYVVAKTEGGKFVRIPKGRTAAVMGELFEQMQNRITGDDVADFNTFFELFMNNIAPSNPIENNILAPIGQAISNTAWYGGDLVPSRLQDLPAEEQYDESTDSISKWLGEKTGLSPYKLNYLIDQYSGGAGDVFLPMLTPEAESGDNSFVGNLLAPWKKEMTTDKVLNNKYPGDFYDLKNELKVKANSSKATDEDILRSMYMTSVSSEMGALYGKKREIQNSDMTDAQKYKEVRKVQEQINAIAERGLNSYETINIDGKYATVGDRRFDYSDYSDRWYEIEGEYLEREQAAVDRYGVTPSEYWNDTDLYYNADKFFKYKQEMEDVAKMVYGGKRFAPYAADMGDIDSKDESGNSVNGLKKKRIINYINSQSNLDYGEKIIMLKMNYPADDSYNYDIIDYLNNRSDISYSEMVTILENLDMKVSADGTVTWK